MKPESPLKQNLAEFNNDWYHPGRNVFVRTLWYFANILVLMNPLNPSSGLKICTLRLFGARIGKNAVIKPGVNIKYPWNLKIGNNCWIGEKVWIDNLGKVTLENNVCISQGAMMICGNHNFSKSTFDLIVGDIFLEEGVWIGAGAIVGPGVRVGTHAILSLGSIASKNLEAWKIYKGNPAQVLRDRTIRE